MDRLQKELVNRDLNLNDPIVKSIYENALKVRDLYGLKSALKFIDEACENHSFYLLNYGY